MDIFGRNSSFFDKSVQALPGRELGARLLVSTTELGRLALCSAQEAAVKFHEDAVEHILKTVHLSNLTAAKPAEDIDEGFIEKIRNEDATPAEAAKLLLETPVTSINLGRYGYEATDSELVDSTVRDTLVTATDPEKHQWHTKIHDDPNGSETKIHVAKRVIGTLDEDCRVIVVERHTYAGFDKTRPNDITRMLNKQPLHEKDTRNMDDIVICPVTTSYYARKLQDDESLESLE